MSRMIQTMILVLTATAFVLAQPYVEDFEDQDVSEWGVYRAGEEPIQALAMGSAPDVLQEGDDFVGLIGDTDVTYSGAAINLVGDVSDANYSVEGWVYVYENHSQGSAYTGLVAYADSSAGYYVKLVADFDADNRFRLYNNQLNMSTFQYTFHVAFDASGVDKTEGWHYMKVEVETQADDNVAYTCYYDNAMLGSGANVDDAEGHTIAGQPGVYAFQMDGVDGLQGYFDNITVTPSAVSVDDERGSLPQDFVLEQNYPNPFNPSTTIHFTLTEASPVQLVVYDLQGNLVNTLVQGHLQAQAYSTNWRGLDALGNPVPTGLYIYTLNSAGQSISKKMMLIK